MNCSNKCGTTFIKNFYSSIFYQVQTIERAVNMTWLSFLRSVRKSNQVGLYWHMQILERLPGLSKVTQLTQVNS